MRFGIREGSWVKSYVLILVAGLLLLGCANAEESVDFTDSQTVEFHVKGLLFFV